MKRVSTVFFTVLLSTAYPCISLADTYFRNVDEVVRHYYQPNASKAAPWRKSTEDAVSVTDYSLCFNKQVHQRPEQILVVMCPDMSQSTYDNEPEPTDIYVLEESEQGYRLVAAEQNVGYRFDGTVQIGAGKWAIHTANSAMNQGYGQTHDSLQLFVGGKFIPVAQWTSWLSNDGALEAEDESLENINNALSIDMSSRDAEFYPLAIHSTGGRNKEKVNKTYRVYYVMDKGEYAIPESLKGGY